MNEHGTIKHWLQKNSTWILGIIVTFLNLYLANQLSPLAQDIRVLQVKVTAIEQRLDNRNERINHSLDKLDGKVDMLIKECD